MAFIQLFKKTGANGFGPRFPLFLNSVPQGAATGVYVAVG